MTTTRILRVTPMRAAVAALAAVSIAAAAIVVPRLVRHPVPELFEGTAPSVGPVGAVVAGQDVRITAFRGWVTVGARLGTAEATVRSAIEEAGGELIEAIPGVGLYTASTRPGTERGLISSLAQHGWVEDAIPAFPVLPAAGAVEVIDAFYHPGTDAGDPCARFHGNLTSAQIRATGLSVHSIDVGAAHVTEPIRGLAHARPRSIVNISMAPKATEEPQYSAQLRSWLRAVFRAVDAGLDAIVVLAAGNGLGDQVGVDLGPMVEELRRRYPKAAGRIVVVEARNRKGKRPGWTNFSTSGGMGAPGEDVELVARVGRPGGQPIDVRERCSGTSFAAPIISHLLARLWAARPDAPAREIIERLRAYVQPTDGVPWDWQKGRWVDDLVAGLPPAPPPSPATDATGSWRGRYTVESPAACAGISGPWSAELRQTAGSVRGSFDSDQGGGEVSGAVAGSDVSWAVGGGGGDIAFNGSMKSAHTVEGTFEGPPCYADPAETRTSGSFFGGRLVEG